MTKLPTSLAGLSCKIDDNGAMRYAIKRDGYLLVISCLRFCKKWIVTRVALKFGEEAYLEYSSPAMWGTSSPLKFPDAEAAYAALREAYALKVDEVTP